MSRSQQTIQVGPGMHPMEALNFYNSDGWDEPELEARRARERKTVMRRALGRPLAAASAARRQTTPCTGCEFSALCQSKQLACNIFAEWAVNKRATPAWVKKLLPSKRWMRLMHEADTVTPLRVAYYSVIDKQTNPEGDDQ
jgi:hypothetical protein